MTNNLPVQAWTDGYADNLPAAASDALEWLLMMQRIVAKGIWRFSHPDSSRLLDGCIEQLRKHMEIGETISEVAAVTAPQCLSAPTSSGLG